jgi:hypothetical protein
MAERMTLLGTPSSSVVFTPPVHPDSLPNVGALALADWVQHEVRKSPEEVPVIETVMGLDVPLLRNPLMLGVAPAPLISMISTSASMDAVAPLVHVKLGDSLAEQFAL